MDVWRGGGGGGGGGATTNKNKFGPSRVWTSGGVLEPRQLDDELPPPPPHPPDVIYMMNATMLPGLPHF